MSETKTTRGEDVVQADGDLAVVDILEPVRLPILPVRDTVLFPYTITSLTVENERTAHLVREAAEGDRLAALVPVVGGDPEPTEQADFLEFGCVGRIIKMLNFPDGTLRILVRGVRRARLEELVASDPYFVGVFGEVSLPPDTSVETEALARTALVQFQEIITLSPSLPDDLHVALLNLDDHSRLADLMADSLNLSFAEKVQILGLAEIRPRFELLASFLNREAVVLRVSGEIQSRVNDVFTKAQREQYLREQLKAVQEQLGQEPEPPELVELRERVQAASLSEGAREAAERELGRLRQMHPSAADYNVSRTYLDWLLSLPWEALTDDKLDIGRASRILEQDHYDLEKVKERILEFLAVLQLKADTNAPILCFVGPPGVGKTSLGQSVARALGRRFVRVSLGGIRDEAEIRGHRRTYVGALPGRVVQGMRKAKAANPVFMLDEIDKIGQDFRGDPASALLEVLDPQQNSAFSDHYLEIPLDLSRVLFITTANLVDPIPPALLDRMEVLRLPGYALHEKRQIARRFLVPRQLEAHGLTRKQVSLRAPAINAIVKLYTSEAGVRNLEREIGTVCRKIARRIVEGHLDPDERTAVTAPDLKGYLGPQKLFPDRVRRSAQVGVATGLAWTAAGGEVLHVEATALAGKGGLTLTGSLGEVMKESAQIALSYVRGKHAELGFDPDDVSGLDIHVHVPAGGTPKDGPSAGATIAAAVASLLSGRPVLPDRAMTGEISLSGRILPVGGIKEKVLAAARAGARMVLLPRENQHDLDDVPDQIKKRVAFELVDDAMDVLRLVVVAPPGRHRSGHGAETGRGPKA